MNNAPQVETLADVMARLNPATQAQEQIIQKQQAGLGAKYGAQKTGLEAAKVKGFNAINTGANARGMAFSGIPIDEQATYLAEKYLPGLQNIDTQQNAEDLALQGQLATIGADKFNKAFSTVEGQKSDLNSWNQMQAQLNATAEQNRLNREASAQEAAANRSASAAETSTPIQDMAMALTAKTGDDGYVHQGTYNSLKNQWIISGDGTAADFDAKFAGYRNPKNNQYKLG